jgi:integrase
MATTISSAALVPVAPAFTNAERLALAGFLAGYSGLTRQAYELDLRQFAGWCQQHQLRLFQARRADIECFARDLETLGRARATITRRLCTVAGFYKYAVEEELLDHSPAAHVRRPRLDYESHVTGLDRNELGALLVAAAGSTPRRRADRTPDSPPRRDHQARHPAHAAARVHHRRAGRRSPAPGRAGSRLARRPAHHHAL